MQRVRIAFLLDSLSGGGAEKVILNLASGFAVAGYSADVLVCKMVGALQNQVPSNVNLVHLNTVSSFQGVLSASRIDSGCLKPVLAMWMRLGKVPGTFKSLPAIIEYLNTNQPTALVSALPKSNINAVLAGQYFGGSIRVVVGVHAHYSAESRLAQPENRVIDRYMLALMRRYYRRADVVVAVSRGVERDICEYLELPKGHVTTVYNPISIGDKSSPREEALDHPWFETQEIPVILGVGRFVAAKDFPLLLEAFATLRQDRMVRLILLGGDFALEEQRSLRQSLMARAEHLGVACDLDMPGFVENPFSYLKKAAVFVLSSRSEGFGNVLVEALLCGCPVVSTDCPGGPVEILANGKYGELVPVGDKYRLAKAICRTLDATPDREKLRTRGADFSIENAVEGYRRLLI